MKYHVTLDRRGVLKIRTTMPKDLLVIASWNNRTELLHTLQATARLAYNQTKAGKDIWLCPGVPEAPNGDAALKAAIVYRDFFERNLWNLTRREAKVRRSMLDLRRYLTTCVPERDAVTREKAKSIVHAVNLEVGRVLRLLEAKP